MQNNYEIENGAREIMKIVNLRHFIIISIKNF